MSALNDTEGRLVGVYAVTVGGDTSDEPIRWLFANELDADAFAEAHGRYPIGNFQVAFVTFEPICYDLDTDTDLAGAFPKYVKKARRALREDV